MAPGVPDVTLRPERPGDAAAIHVLTDLAFGNVDDESAIIDRLRASDRWIPELSIVAEAPDGRIVGHCVTSVGDLVAEDGSVRPILGLGPISVAPDRQGEGIGGALITRTRDVAAAAGWPIIALLGHPTFYLRFGFEPARALGIRQRSVSIDVHGRMDDGHQDWASRNRLCAAGLDIPVTDRRPAVTTMTMPRRA